ncbi:MAG: hypothetical protein R6V47_00725 [Candidatus Delongbacteria bacterium]
MKVYLIFIFFIISSIVRGADIFSYLDHFSKDLYTEKNTVHSDFAVSNGWDRICTTYSDIYKYRLNSTDNTSLLVEKIEFAIRSLNRNKIKRITPYEKEFITALFYGALAYIRSEDPSYRMFLNIKKAFGLFDKLEEKYRTPDSKFGNALTEIGMGLYFENSFWIGTVMGKRGDISKGIQILDTIAFEGDILTIEANLFLIEYYSDILKDHNSSLKYSKNLSELMPGSRYFTYLYGRDLYHTGRILEAKKLFRSVNDGLCPHFYPYDYDSVIYEAKCFYILGQNDKAEQVIGYASEIHDGYILNNFRNDWIYSVNVRQKTVFAIHNLRDHSHITDDELKRLIETNFDHGNFRQVNNLIRSVSEKDDSTKIISFRTAIIMSDWRLAEKIHNRLLKDDKNIFRHHPDRKRLGILVNIKDNYLRNRKNG